jgi:dTMP kinase
MKGMLIVFEGGEGAGKTTQAQRLADRLTTAQRDVVLTREPGGTPLGKRLRHLLLDPELARPNIPPMAEFLLYAADRAAHVELVIRPAIEAGKVVISDRFTDSSVAYQGGGNGIQQVLLVSEIATGFLQPDLVVLLDVDPQVGLGRVADRGERSSLVEAKELAFHQRVRAAFLARAAGVHVTARSRRYMVLDATQPPNVIAGQVADRVAELTLETVRRRAKVDA